MNEIEIKILELPESHKYLPTRKVGVCLTKENNKFIFYMSFYGDQFCCGLYSIGSFSVYENSSFITDEERSLAIKKLLETVLKFTKEKNKEIGLFFTLINNTVCNYVRDAVKDESLFKIVKVFENRNSHNINTMYVNV